MRESFISEGHPETVLHRLDVRTKMLVSAAAAVTVIVLNSAPALSMLVAASCVYILLTRRWKVVAVAWLAVLLLWLIAVGCMQIMLEFLPRFTARNLTSLMVPFMRSVVLVNTVLAMALSSRVQGLLTALKSLRLPYWLYIPAAVMVRFLPSFVEDIRQIAETMRIRGYSLNPFAMMARPVLSFRLLFVPVLFRALRTSDELGIAAELKGIGYSSAVSRYRDSRFAAADYGALAVAGWLLAAALVINAGSAATAVMGM